MRAPRVDLKGAIHDAVRNPWPSHGFIQLALGFYGKRTTRCPRKVACKWFGMKVYRGSTSGPRLQLHMIEPKKKLTF